MATSLMLDTGFWFALFDNRDAYHEEAADMADLLEVHQVVLPWPTLYEVLSTRFVRQRLWIKRFSALMGRKNSLLLPDEPYRFQALENLFNLTRPGKPFSLVDEVIRQMLADINIRIDALITFNPADFADVCHQRKITIFP